MIFTPNATGALKLVSVSLRARRPAPSSTRQLQPVIGIHEFARAGERRRPRFDHPPSCVDEHRLPAAAEPTWVAQPVRVSRTTNFSGVRYPLDGWSRHRAHGRQCGLDRAVRPEEPSRPPRSSPTSSRSVQLPGYPPMCACVAAGAPAPCGGRGSRAGRRGGVGRREVARAGRGQGAWEHRDHRLPTRCSAACGKWLDRPPGSARHSQPRVACLTGATRSAADPPRERAARSEIHWPRRPGRDHCTHVPRAARRNDPGEQAERLAAEGRSARTVFFATWEQLRTPRLRRSFAARPASSAGARRRRQRRAVRFGRARHDVRRRPPVFVEFVRAAEGSPRGPTRSRRPPTKPPARAPGRAAGGACRTCASP